MIDFGNDYQSICISKAVPPFSAALSDALSDSATSRHHIRGESLIIKSMPDSQRAAPVDLQGVEGGVSDFIEIVLLSSPF